MCDGNKSRGIRHTLRGWCRWFLFRRFGESLIYDNPRRHRIRRHFKSNPFLSLHLPKTSHFSQELHHTQIIPTSTSSPVFLSIVRVLSSTIKYRVCCQLGYKFVAFSSLCSQQSIKQTNNWICCCCSMITLTKAQRISRVEYGFLHKNEDVMRHKIDFKALHNKICRFFCHSNVCSST